MKPHLHRGLSVALCLFSALSLVTSANAAVLKQSDSRDKHGQKDFSYFFIEAEDFDSNDPYGFGESWLLSSDEDSLFVTVSEEIDPETDEPFELDPGAFASGGESITNAIVQSTANNTEGGGHDVQYLLEFDTPGDYYLYIRQHSPMGPENNRNRNDSFYYPIEFGEEPIQLKANGDDYGLLESMEFPGDTFRRGPWVWFAAREDVFNDEQDPPIDQDPDTFVEFEVTDQMVGETLVLDFDHRENGAMLDAFLFISVDSDLPPTNGEGPDGDGFFGPGDLVDEEFGLLNLGVEPPMGIPGDYNGDTVLDAKDIDLQAVAMKTPNENLETYDENKDGTIDLADRTIWVDTHRGTWMGDSNLDDEFNSGDLVQVFAAGLYEKDEMATWGQGDWNGDMRFGSGDLVVAFAAGGYEVGPRERVPPPAAVPEPSALGMALLGLLFLVTRRYRRAR